MLRDFFLNKATELALRPLKKASHQPHPFLVPQSGARGVQLTNRLLLPLPMYYSADIPEARRLANIGDTTFPIVPDLVPKTSLAEIDVEAPVRTERHMKKVRFLLAFFLNTYCNYFCSMSCNLIQTPSF